MKRQSVLSLEWGKKGASEVLILKAFDMVLAAITILTMLMFLKNTWDDTFLEKTYMARDLGMLITTAYASPGELDYCYYEDHGYKFSYGIENSLITIKDRKGEVTYSYLDDSARPVPALIVPYDETKPDLAFFEIIKDSSGVKVAAKRKGEASDTCKT